MIWSPDQLSLDFLIDLEPRVDCLVDSSFPAYKISVKQSLRDIFLILHTDGIYHVN